MKRKTVYFASLMILTMSLISCSGASTSIQPEATPDLTATQDFIAAETETAEALLVSQTQTAEALSISQTQTAMPRNCTVSGTYVDIDGDTTIPYLDILKVDSKIDDDLLTVVVYLKELPEEIQVGKGSDGNIWHDYSYSIDIDADNDTSTGSSGTPQGIDHVLFFPPLIFSEIASYPLTASQLKANNIYEIGEGGGFYPKNKLNVVADNEMNALTFSGLIPGINENSKIYISTYQQFPEYIVTDTLCE